MKLSPLLCLITLVSYNTTSYACDPTGAYGINFGEKPHKSSKKIKEGKAAIWYYVTPPKPDARFDTYIVRADAKSKEIFQIDAIKTIIAKERAESLTPDQREEGENNAKSFAHEYVASLPSNIQASLVDKYGTSHWEGNIFNGILLEISTDFAWDVTVSCRDIGRENIMGRRVLPEMYSPNK